MSHPEKQRQTAFFTHTAVLRIWVNLYDGANVDNSVSQE